MQIKTEITKRGEPIPEVIRLRLGESLDVTYTLSFSQKNINPAGHIEALRLFAEKLDAIFNACERGKNAPEEEG